MDLVLIVVLFFIIVLLVNTIYSYIRNKIHQGVIIIQEHLTDKVNDEEESDKSDNSSSLQVRKRINLLENKVKSLNKQLKTIELNYTTRLQDEKQKYNDLFVRVDNMIKNLNKSAKASQMANSKTDDLNKHLEKL